MFSGRRTPSSDNADIFAMLETYASWPAWHRWVWRRLGF